MQVKLDDPKSPREREAVSFLVIFSFPVGKLSTQMNFLSPGMFFKAFPTTHIPGIHL